MNAEHVREDDERSGCRHKGKPCCGKVHCTCPCPRVHENRMKQLEQFWLQSPLITAQDTTDVSGFIEVFKKKRLPLLALWRYASVHVLFNQTYLLRMFDEQGVIRSKSPYIPDWEQMGQILQKEKARGHVVRSSNFYSVTLKALSLVHKAFESSTALVPANPTRRDVLSAQILWASAPETILTMYEQRPTRELWAALLATFQENVSRVSSGLVADYMVKCIIDRVSASYPLQTGSISAWPVNCPGYKLAYAKLFRQKPKDRESKFQALCYIYKRLNAKRPCTMCDALSQLCWLKKLQDKQSKTKSAKTKKSKAGQIPKVNSQQVKRK